MTAQASSRLSRLFLAASLVLALVGSFAFVSDVMASPAWTGARGHPQPGPPVWCVEIAGPSRWEGIYELTPEPVWVPGREAYAVWVGGPGRPPAYFPGAWLCAFWTD